MRKLFLILCFFCSVILAKSQNVEGKAPNSYKTHTVAPKENFYSIGRLYNLSPKSIADFNSISMEKGLVIGQHLKIPSNTQNAEPAVNANTAQSTTPLTHIVAKNETLFRIGNNYKVSVDLLRKWNNLSSDNIIPGTSLIVGNGTMTNVQATQPETKTVAAPTVTTAVTAPGRKPAAEVKETPIPKETAIANEMAAEPKKETPLNVAQNDVVVEKKAVVPNMKTTANAHDSSMTGTSKTEPFGAVTATTTGDQAAMPAGVATQDAKPIEKTIQAKDVPAKQADVMTSMTNSNNTGSIDMGGLSEGAFANNFPVDAAAKSLSSKSGEAATFKSTSGWQDKKYYVLMNDVTPGTILKITSAENKFVYAKVLGSMPEMKENNGILLRISNAAASHLGIIDPKFPVQISYFQ